ncbi:hypothetical protein [Acidovorax sp.]|uniref:hypothetical protein n=1 Tax=Acidovorax sp. TaxID=1872122 RepID=UPI00391F29D2
MRTKDIGKALEEKFLRRALGWDGKPFTKESLGDRCKLHIELYGRDAKTSVMLAGERGLGLKTRRRLFPTGPLGEINYASKGRLEIEFPSGDLLKALQGTYAVHSALIHHYLNHAEPPYPTDMPLELAIQFAHQCVDVRIAEDIVEALFARIAPSPIGNAYRIITGLLEVEDIASQRRWKVVDLQKWKASGLLEPVVQRPTPVRSNAPRSEPAGVVVRVTERQARLLLQFDRLDEAGKRHVEQTAAFAAAAAAGAVTLEGRGGSATLVPKVEAA